MSRRWEGPRYIARGFDVIHQLRNSEKKMEKKSAWEIKWRDSNEIADRLISDAIEEAIDSGEFG
jgi:hypothetical protein